MSKMRIRKRLYSGYNRNEDKNKAQRMLRVVFMDFTGLLYVGLNTDYSGHY